MKITRTNRITVTIDTPAIPVQLMRELIEGVPDNATITVQPVMGGDQRESWPVGARISIDLP